MGDNCLHIKGVNQSDLFAIDNWEELKKLGYMGSG
jgi:hypothetical protein